MNASVGRLFVMRETLISRIIKSEDLNHHGMTLTPDYIEANQEIYYAALAARKQRL